MYAYFYALGRVKGFAYISTQRSTCRVDGFLDCWQGLPGRDPGVRNLLGLSEKARYRSILSQPVFVEISSPDYLRVM